MKIEWSSINYSSLSKIIRDDSAGVYAWYYKINLSTFDSKRLVEDVNNIERLEDRKVVVKDFLERKLFNFFRYPEFSAKISGALIPTFTGSLEHNLEMTESLVDRIANDPDTILSVREALKEMAPEFSSPLYVGMASNLKRRLIQHKNLMLNIKDRKGKSFEDDVQKNDKNFAERVVSRGFVLNDMFVCVSEMSADDGLHNIIENIINRVNYPILGRN